MSRRRLSFMLLAALAVQMLGGFALESACAEPCPDDAQEESCPPVCALCTACANSQSAIVAQAAPGSPSFTAERQLIQPSSGMQSPRPSDIFHVPLPG